MARNAGKHGLMPIRNIFNELMAGVAAMKSHREGKITLRSYRVERAVGTWHSAIAKPKEED